MEKFTTKQRTKIVEFYFEYRRSTVLTQRAYCWHFNVTSDFMIRRLIHCFQHYGSVSDLPWSGRKRSVYTEENHQCVQEGNQEEPGNTICRCSVQFGIPQTSLYCIIRTDMHLYPFKVQPVQSLKPIDYRHSNNAVHIQRLVNEDNEFEWQSSFPSEQLCE